MNTYNENNTSYFAQVNDKNNSYKVHYHDCGVGDEVIVMLHGSGPGASGWSNFSRNIKPLINNGYRVILMDCPGWSKSDTVVCTESRSEFNARVLKALLNYLNISRIHLIGNSMGGHSAAVFTLDYPDLVNRVILMGGGTGGVSPFVPMPTEGIKLLQQVYREPNQYNLEKMMDIFVYDSKDLTQELIKSRLDNILNNLEHLESFIKSFQLNPRQFPDITHRLNQIKTPTLIIWGRDDRFVPMDLGFRLLANIENSELHIFNKCGHWVQWEHAERFNTIVLDFIKS